MKYELRPLRAESTPDTTPVWSGRQRPTQAEIDAAFAAARAQRLNDDTLVLIRYGRYLGQFTSSARAK